MPTSQKKEVTKMKKVTYVNTMSYIYEADRKGAKYSIDGGNKYMNHGEYAECLAKHLLGYEAHKDGCTAFDKGDDIPELNASVKSLNCSLSDCKDMPKDPTAFMEAFWERDHSSMFIWVDDYADMVDLWFMNKEEFKRFAERFATWEKSLEKYRIKVCRNKIIAYLEAHI